MANGRLRADDGPADRGQAYTLEGVMAGILVVSALLFATHSLVLTPTTDGSVDGSVRADLRRTAADVLATGASHGSLSRTVRYWNDSVVERTFAGAVRPEVGYGNGTPPTILGDVLEQRVTSRGYRINLQVVCLAGTDGESRSIQVVYQGVPSADAVVATHPVTLFDGDPLTGPGAGGLTVSEAAGSGVFPVPDVARNGSLFNVCEVRLVVW